MKFSVGISAKCMEEIHVLTFPTLPAAGAVYSQLIRYEA